jgi:hypothetical protein
MFRPQHAIIKLGNTVQIGVTDVSEGNSTLIFSVKSLLRLLDSEEEGIKLLRNVGN